MSSHRESRPRASPPLPPCSKRNFARAPTITGTGYAVFLSTFIHRVCRVRRNLIWTNSSRGHLLSSGKTGVSAWPLSSDIDQYAGRGPLKVSQTNAHTSSSSSSSRCASTTYSIWFSARRISLPSLLLPSIYALVPWTSIVLPFLAPSSPGLDINGTEAKQKKQEHNPRAEEKKHASLLTPILCHSYKHAILPRRGPG